MLLPKIFDGTDLANEKGFSSYRDWITGATLIQRVEANRATNPMGKKAIDPASFKMWNGNFDEALPPLIAYINHGRWLARCDECKNIEYVTPADAIFYCHNCSNERYSGNARPVHFPNDRKKIEKDLLKRHVHHWNSEIREIMNTHIAFEAAPDDQPLDWVPA